MKLKFVTLILTLASVGVGQEAKANSYSTSFPDAESPLSQGGAWVNGQAQGVNWSNCASIPGLGYGTQTGTSSTYNDSTCVLTGTWGQNQTAQGTVLAPATVNAWHEEVELRLNTTISAGNITGYEITTSAISVTPYIQLVRWDGCNTCYTPLTNLDAVAVKTGDVIEASRSGATITVTKNGAVVFSVNDSTYLGGAPGMGFYQDHPGVAYQILNQQFGWSSFSASDGTAVAAQSGPAPTISLKFTPTTSQTELLKAQVSSSSGCASVTQWNAVSTVTGNSYTDAAVTENGYYCYTLVPISNGLPGLPSSIIEVQATSASSTGSVLSPPPVPLQITVILGSVLN